jgi:hypothetical protein
VRKGQSGFVDYFSPAHSTACSEHGRQAFRPIAVPPEVGKVTSMTSRLLCALVCMSLVLPTVSRAQCPEPTERVAYIGIRSIDAEHDPHFPLCRMTPGETAIQLVVFTSEVARLRCTNPAPGELIAGINWGWGDYGTNGAFELDCNSGLYVLGQVFTLVDDAEINAVREALAATEWEFEACDNRGVFHPAQIILSSPGDESGDCFGSCLPIRPYALDPDGDTDWPLDSPLEFVVPIGALVHGPHGSANVYVGRAPDCSDAELVDSSHNGKAYPVLQPNTTYYWRIETPVSGDVDPDRPCVLQGGVSRVYSFTTADAPLKVEPTSWGKIKALYRE